MNVRDIVAPNPGPFTLDGTRTYLIGDAIVLDPGPSIDSHIRAIRDAMPNLRTILITHRHADHAPAAIPLKQATGARIVAPLDDVDQRVSDGDVVEGLEVIATPGHTSEHVCYLTPDGDLFTGDTILGFGTTTPTAMRTQIYPDLDARLHDAAEIQITAHLIKLIEEGRVVQNAGAYQLA